MGAYLSDTYDAIVIKDILQRNRINDPGLLTALLNFLMDNIANPFSARSVTAALAANGIKTDDGHRAELHRIHQERNDRYRRAPL